MPRCSREACQTEFEPRAPHQRYCGSKCRMAVNNLTYKKTPKAAARDARYYARGGWYSQYTRRLRRRIRQRLEEVG